MSNEFQKITADLRDRVQELAYLFWETAGRQQGMAMDYWLAAEREIFSAMQAAGGTITPAPAGDAAATAAPVAPLPAAAAPTPEPEPVGTAAAEKPASAAAADTPVCAVETPAAKAPVEVAATVKSAKAHRKAAGRNK